MGQEGTEKETGVVKMSAEQMTYTQDYFHSQVLEFRNLMGSKKFWSSDEDGEKLRTNAVHALSFVYFNLKTSLTNEEIIKECAIYDATLKEYNRRALMMGVFA